MSRLLLPLIAVAPLVAQPPSAALDALAGLDPVALARGRELPGEPSRSLVHGRFRYRFANEETLATFSSDPARWAIQLGGGCGGMGPLAGIGRPDLFAIHDARIYVFASEACRERFRSDPDRQIDRPDPVAEGDESSAVEARRSIDRAVEACGGAAALDGLVGLRFHRTEAAEWRGRTYETGAALHLEFPDRVRLEAWWDDWRRVDAVVGERGFVSEVGATPAGTWRHAPVQASTLRRHARRLPLVILRSRAAPDFVAFHVGEGRSADEREFDSVVCSFAGTTTVLDVDRETGHVTRIRYHDRLPATPRGEITVAFEDFRSVDGLMLPFRSTTTLDDRPPVVRQWSAIEVLTTSDDSLFSLPD